MKITFRSNIFCSREILFLYWIQNDVFSVLTCLLTSLRALISSRVCLVDTFQIVCGCRHRNLCHTDAEAEADADADADAESIVRVYSLAALCSCIRMHWCYEHLHILAYNAAILMLNKYNVNHVTVVVYSVALKM